jgi:hypothetical protein
MSLRWLLGDYADADFKLTRQQRRDISRIAHERFLPRRAFLTFTFLCILPPVLLAFLALPYVLAWLGYAGRNAPFMIGAAIICFLFWPWSAWLYARIYARPCRQAMVALGRSICLRCGYCLEGLDPAATPACPECGEPRRPIESSAPAPLPPSTPSAP